MEHERVLHHSEYIPNWYRKIQSMPFSVFALAAAPQDHEFSHTVPLGESYVCCRHKRRLHHSIGNLWSLMLCIMGKHRNGIES